MASTYDTLSAAPMLPRRLNEVGKVRIGCQVPIEHGKNAGKPRPERLKYFRLTSNSHAALTIAAQKYGASPQHGGGVRPWIVPPEWKDRVQTPDHRFELYTEADTLDILIRADALMDTQFEQWDGAYCTRRCTGEFITFDGYGKLEGLECQCPPTLDARKALAAEGKACIAVSRLCVMLEGLPLGQWRLDTRGDNTPAEVRGLQDILAACGVGQTVLKATMRLEFRTSRRMTQGKKEVHHYSCVVIEPRYTPEQLLAEGERRQTKLLAMPDEHAKTTTEHIADLTGDQVAVQTHLNASRHGSTVQVDTSNENALTVWGSLAAVQERLGWTEEHKHTWENTQARRFKKTYSELPLETVAALVAELETQEDPNLPREGTKEAQPPSESTPSTPESIVEHPGGFQPLLHPSAWRDTLEAHKDTAGLPNALRTKVKLALHPGSETTDAKGLELAGAVLDWLTTIESGEVVS